MSDPEELIDVSAAGSGSRVARVIPALLSDLADWLAPKTPRSRWVAVPDFTGMRVSSTARVASRAGVKRTIQRLSEPPAPVDGMVVRQSPRPHKRVRRDSRVTLFVLHEQPRS